MAYTLTLDRYLTIEDSVDRPSWTPPKPIKFSDQEARSTTLAICMRRCFDERSFKLRQLQQLTASELKQLMRWKVEPSFDGSKADALIVLSLKLEEELADRHAAEVAAALEAATPTPRRSKRARRGRAGASGA
jgi:hypothetical protein